MRAASASIPRVELRHATGVQNNARASASVTLAAVDSAWRSGRLVGEPGSRQLRIAATTVAIDAIATKSASAVTTTRSTTLSNNGPPGRNRLTQTKAMNAASAIHRSRESAPESAAVAIRTKNAVAVASNM